MGGNNNIHNESGVDTVHSYAGVLRLRALELPEVYTVRTQGASSISDICGLCGYSGLLLRALVSLLDVIAAVYNYISQCKTNSIPPVPHCSEYPRILCISGMLGASVCG